jgi:hypothetical protein
MQYGMTSLRREVLLQFVRHRWSKPLETFSNWLQQAERIDWLFCQAVRYALEHARTHTQLSSVWPAADPTADRSTTMLGAFAADFFF